MPSTAKTAKPPKPDPKKQYTIDELASVSQVPSRTIRFYQSKGALPKPEIVGRVAFYNDTHIERLHLIAQLQDRGLSIKAIRDLVKELDAGRLDLNSWLGLESQMKMPWSSDKPQLLSEADLEKRYGALRPGLVAELQEFGLVRKQGEAYFVPSPMLLQISMGMEKSGIDLAMAAGGGLIMRKYISKAAQELADYYMKHAGRGFGRRATAKDLGDAFEAVRPLGLDAVKLIFGQEMERVLREAVASGRATALQESTKKR